MNKITIKITIFVTLWLFAGSVSLAAQPTYEQTLAAASAGNADAQNALGLIYFSGQKGENKASEGLEWFEKAANQGHSAAMFNLGTLYYNGKFTLPNKAKGTQWIQKAANAGNSEALYLIGTMYQSGEITGISDFNQAATYISIAASNGLPEAQNRLGYFYSNGLGVVKNDNIAHEWYLKAANAGLAKGQHNVGQDYFFGTGVEKNEKTAISWYKKAAKAGYSESQMKLAALANRERDTEKSIQLHEKAPKSGNQKAKGLLGNLKPDKNELKASNNSAATNNADAVNDPDSALRLYSEKAKAGDKNAQYELGRIYLHMGNEKEGVKWIEEAAANGHPGATKLLELNSNYHENNAYIDKINAEKRQQYEQQRRSRENLRQDTLRRWGR